MLFALLLPIDKCNKKSTADTGTYGVILKFDGLKDNGKQAFTLNW
jgi:hypothetical protein